MSRREADELISAGRAEINGQTANLGRPVNPGDRVSVDGRTVDLAPLVYLSLNKPIGYISSRRGQGAGTIYDLLPQQYRGLKSVGRLDKDTSGLILLTNDGDWSHQMTHPKFKKLKIYEVRLDKPLSPKDKTAVELGVRLADGPSRLKFRANGGSGPGYVIQMSEGRNRQIRRTFLALGYRVDKLHRIRFGPYSLNGLKSGQFKEIRRLN